MYHFDILSMILETQSFTFLSEKRIVILTSLHCREGTKIMTPQQSPLSVECCKNIIVNAVSQRSYYLKNTNPNNLRTNACAVEESMELQLPLCQN